MRTIRSSVALLLILSLATAALAAGGPEQIAGPQCGGDYHGDGCDPCCGHCRHHCGHHCLHHLFGQGNRWDDAGFNCGCNGSYKFPVPPLYTYHWPGMYQAVLMTDYHSPWRFPPLRPYVDETRVEVLGKAGTLRRVQPASATTSTSLPSRSASFSQRMEETLR